mmetsp:Transcript_6579/g.8900  ORF Transcript_6579/g.8900 Transcript_6579/m.8900 type:complete len:793 (+) Transcript_6579:124-2502(+)
MASGKIRLLFLFLTLLYVKAFISTLGSVGVNKTPVQYGLKTLKMSAVEDDKKTDDVMRPRYMTSWDELSNTLKESFGYDDNQIQEYSELTKEELVQMYDMMVYCRDFENACNVAYMQGHIRGFMHLDNGQESIPALVANAIKNGDTKYSYYRDHTHALASGVSGGAVMAELFGKDGGTCRGAGGSMHVYDKDTHFQGGWALVAEQLPYAVGAARSIKLDRILDPEGHKNDDRISIVFVGEGGSQNGRMAECLNSAAKEKLPVLFLSIDNGRAINTFTEDVAKNSDVYLQGKHYGVPGLKVDGCNAVDTVRAGKAVVDYVRNHGPAQLQVHTYRFQGHSPADPEHERGRKQEKVWARAQADPIKIFESMGLLSEEEMIKVRAEVKERVKADVKFATESPPPPRELAKELEYPDPVDTDYNLRPPPKFKNGEDAETVSRRVIDPEALKNVEAHMDKLKSQAKAGQITLADAVNLAVLEEMIRDPSTTMHAEDLQAGSSYAIPYLTQQTFGSVRAADEIIDEGHFIGKSIGEGMNGYRPIVELMNTNFGIYGMAEISSAGNTYATTGGQFKMPLTIIGAGGTAPNQALGAEHSQPLHAYVMGIPGLKICSAASADAAYGLTKSMIRDDGPGILFFPVKMMKAVKGTIEPGQCMPLNKSATLHKASDDAVARSKAVTVLTYLHGVKECETAIPTIMEEGADIDLIELRALKPLDLDTIKESLQRTHKLIILDESTYSGGVGATISAQISENLYDELDAPIMRLCMDDAPVPYASSMEEAVVKRASDLIDGVMKMLF